MARLNGTCVFTATGQHGLADLQRRDFLLSDAVGLGANCRNRPRPAFICVLKDGTQATQEIHDHSELDGRGFSALIPAYPTLPMMHACVCSVQSCLSEQQLLAGCALREEHWPRHMGGR